MDLGADGWGTRDVLLPLIEWVERILSGLFLLRVPFQPLSALVW